MGVTTTIDRSGGGGGDDMCAADLPTVSDLSVVVVVVAFDLEDKLTQCM